jgi:rod shape-determining protein MreB
VITPAEIREAVEPVVSEIVQSVKRCLAKSPPQLAQDFLTRGMYMVGGGALLNGLADRISEETLVPVRMSEAPLEAVVYGAGYCIENYSDLKGMFMGQRR